MYSSVFLVTAGDRTIYQPFMPSTDPDDDDNSSDTYSARFRRWRTWQMSDHRPLWIEIETDYADDYLGKFAAP